MAAIIRSQPPPRRRLSTTFLTATVRVLSTPHPKLLLRLLCSCSGLLSDDKVRALPSQAALNHRCEWPLLLPPTPWSPASLTWPAHVRQRHRAYISSLAWVPHHHHHLASLRAPAGPVPRRSTCQHPPTRPLCSPCPMSLPDARLLLIDG